MLDYSYTLPRKNSQLASPIQHKRSDSVDLNSLRLVSSRRSFTDSNNSPSVSPPDSPKTPNIVEPHIDLDRITSASREFQRRLSLFSSPNKINEAAEARFEKPPSILGANYVAKSVRRQRSDSAFELFSAPKQRFELRNMLREDPSTNFNWLLLSLPSTSIQLLNKYANAEPDAESKDQDTLDYNHTVTQDVDSKRANNDASYYTLEHNSECSPPRRRSLKSFLERALRLK